MLDLENIYFKHHEYDYDPPEDDIMFIEDSWLEEEEEEDE